MCGERAAGPPLGAGGGQNAGRLCGRRRVHSPRDLTAVTTIPVFSRRQRRRHRSQDALLEAEGETGGRHAGGGTRVGSTSRGPRRRGRLCKRPGGRRSSVGFGGGGLGVGAAGPGLPRLHTGAPRGSAPSPGQFPLHAGFSGAPRRWLVCVSVGCTQTRVVTGGRWAVRVAVWLWASSRLPGLAPVARSVLPRFPLRHVGMAGRMR